MKKGAPHPGRPVHAISVLQPNGRLPFFFSKKINKPQANKKKQQKKVHPRHFDRFRKDVFWIHSTLCKCPCPPSGNRPCMESSPPQTDGASQGTPQVPSRRAIEAMVSHPEARQEEVCLFVLRLPSHHPQGQPSPLLDEDLLLPQLHQGHPVRAWPGLREGARR